MREPLILNSLKMLDIPEPSPSLTKNASDLGDHENIAGGSTCRPLKRIVLPLIDILPFEANFITRRLLGDGNSTANLQRLDERIDSTQGHRNPCSPVRSWRSKTRHT